MMDKPWFDPETGTSMLGGYAAEIDSYGMAVEDEGIAGAELDARTQRAASPTGRFAPAAARRGAFAGGQSPRHRGVVRVGGAQRFGSQAPANHFHATAVKEALAADLSKSLRQRCQQRQLVLKGAA